MKFFLRNRLQTLLVLTLILGLAPVVSAQTKPTLRRRTPTRRAATVLVPVGTNLKVRINDTLSSKDSRIGDRFTATVIDPSRFDEATLSGHISSIQKSGKIKGRTSMNLAFDSVELRDGRRGVLHGYVTRVYGEGAGRADEEGGVESGSRTKQTVKRAGIGATVGAIVGGIADANTPKFREYVVREHHPSYKYSGEVVIGTTLPETGVTYWEVPKEYGVTEYRYTIVNDRTVLVDPRTHKIIQIIGG